MVSVLNRLGVGTVRPCIALRTLVNEQFARIRQSGDMPRVEACASELSQILGYSPDGCRAVIKALPVDQRETFIATAIQEHFKDHEMDRLIRYLSAEEQRALGVAAMAAHFGQDFKEEFNRFDKDDSGSLNRSEFNRYLQKVTASRFEKDSSPPSTRQLIILFCNAALPNVIFGMLDNSIMIIGGDIVEETIGSTLHLSTLACAAVANTFADVFGMSVGNSVDRFSAKLGMPSASLTPEQIKLPIVRRVSLVAGPFGILVGCTIGMTPLLFISDKSNSE